jgi:hypothetical protein
VSLDVQSVILAVGVLLLGADKLFAALERVGAVPQRLYRWDRNRAAQLVEHQRRDEALARLAGKADAILLELMPNGGASLRDLAARVEAKVNEIDVKLGAHIDETAPLIVEHHELVEHFAAHLKSHGS